MSEFEDRLNSILGDPAQMEKITAMAQSLLGAQEPLKSEPKLKGTPSSGMLENLDPAMLGRLGGALGRVNRSDEKRALLEALKPYLSPRRQEKLERAMKLAKMIGVAGVAFEMFGGDDAKI